MYHQMPPDTYQERDQVDEGQRVLAPHSLTRSNSAAMQRQGQLQYQDQGTQGPYAAPSQVSTVYGSGLMRTTNQQPWMRAGQSSLPVHHFTGYHSLYTQTNGQHRIQMYEQQQPSPSQINGQNHSQIYQGVRSAPIPPNYSTYDLPVQTNGHWAYDQQLQEAHVGSHARVNNQRNLMTWPSSTARMRLLSQPYTNLR